MIPPAAIDDLARRLIDLVPSASRDTLAEAREDFTANFKDTLRAGLRKLDLVSRDEFDVQRCVLLRTREMVESLEHRVAELEAQLGHRTAH